jgi:hypothetical protein
VTPPAAPAWRVEPVGEELRVAYGPLGRPGHVPQVAVLHRRDGFFRLAPAGAAWGTSAVLPPARWTGGRYVQGAPVAATSRLAGDALVLALTGDAAGLPFVVTLRLAPPAAGRLTATVRVRLRGPGAAAPLDARPGEAAKLAVLSSMRVSRARWDARAALVGPRRLPLPPARPGGWLVAPPAPATAFGLLGGSSAWKRAAPTLVVRLDRPLAVTGWLTPRRDPDGDNLSLWAAAAAFPPTWTYELIAAPGAP